MARPDRAVSPGFASIVVIALILIVGFGIFLINTLNSVNTRNAASLNDSGTSHSNSISLQGFSLSLCSTNCVYPSPYLSGIIAINGTVLVSSVVMYVNGTFNGYVLQNPSTRPVGPCNGGPNQTCTIKAGGTCVGSGGQSTCTYQYASCFIDSGSSSCTATVTGEMNTLTVFDEWYKGGLPSSIPAIVNDTYVIMCAATFQDNSQSNATAVITAT